MTDKKISDLAKVYADVLTGVEKDHSIIEKVGHFDELRKKSTIAQLERLAKERNPTQYHYQAQRFFQNFEQELGYFVGVTDKPGKFDDMKFEEQVSMYSTLGQKLIGDIINPER